MNTRQYISFAIVLIIGIIIGYFLSDIARTDVSPDVITTHTVDTLIQSEIVEVPVEIKTKVKEVDTVYIQSDDVVKPDSNVLNTDTVSFIETDTLVTDDSILQDKKISQIKVKLVDLSTTEKDTLLEKLLDVKTVKNESVTIEFWESPVNYTGYKLSKSRLIIYGLVQSEDLKFYKRDSDYCLKVNGLYYSLIETGVYLKYTQTEKPEFIDD